MTQKRVKKTSFAFMHKVAAATALIAFVVMIMGGIMHGVRAVTIIVRSFAVIFLIMLISRILIKVLASYEEMNGGKS